MTKRVLVISLGVSALATTFAVYCVAAPPAAPLAGKGRQVNPAVEAVQSVTIKDWNPESSLVVAETKIDKARFPVIDAHSHHYVKTAVEVAEWVRVMDEVGVETTVILTGAVGENFDRLVDLYLKPHPGRFQLYAGVLHDHVDAPDYPQRAAAELERCYRKGARGIGELSDKGAGFGANDRGEPLHPDDPRLDPFWKKAVALKMPANLHMADHPSAWRPADNTQERSPSYQVYNQYGKKGPSYGEILQIRDRLLARHPAMTFIACHLSNQGNDLAALSKVLDRFSNVYIDISARDYELGRQPRAAAKFLGRYKDRILFGTDMGTQKGMYQRWWRFLESSDEYLKGSNWWRLYALALPEPVLEALYRGNARRLLNWTAP